MIRYTLDEIYVLIDVNSLNAERYEFVESFDSEGLHFTQDFTNAIVRSNESQCFHLVETLRDLGLANADDLTIACIRISHIDRASIAA